MAAEGSNLFKLITPLRYAGAGTKVTRSIFKFPETYWIITRVKPSADPSHGKAWGKLVWRGRLKEKEERIRTGLKKEWKLLEFPDYQKFSGNVGDIIKAVPIKP